MNPSSGPEDHQMVFEPVLPEDAGSRLDTWLALKAPFFSRSRWQALVREGCVQVNGVAGKPNRSLTAGDLVRAAWRPPVDVSLKPEAIDLDILHEDADIIVINKPPGLVVHPAPGHPSGTLVNALLGHCRDLAGIGGERRPGIVHRLDRDTSGVLVVAKNEAAMKSLASQFKQRTTQKEYIALVWGRPSPARGTIEAPIGRDPVHRKKMSTRSRAGRGAITHYRTLDAAGPLTLLHLVIETGRTHQIRVHLAHIGHPVAGDPVYGRKRPPDLPERISRQLLHAWKLTLRHPRTNERILFEAPWPPDITAVMDACRKERLPES